VIEARGPKPLAEAVVAVDLGLRGGGTEAGELVERGVEGLDAAVEGGGVEPLDRRV
jgi:hypothetical protein